MSDFLNRMTGRKWIGLVMVCLLGVYLFGGDQVVVTMEGLPDKMTAFFALMEKVLPFLGIVGAYFGFAIGQGNADAAKEKGKAQVKAAEIIKESK